MLWLLHRLFSSNLTFSVCLSVSTSPPCLPFRLFFCGSHRIFGESNLCRLIKHNTITSLPFLKAIITICFCLSLPLSLLSYPAVNRYSSSSLSSQASNEVSNITGQSESSDEVFNMQVVSRPSLSVIHNYMQTLADQLTLTKAVKVVDWVLIQTFALVLPTEYFFKSPSLSCLSLSALSLSIFLPACSELCLS